MPTSPNAEAGWVPTDFDLQLMAVSLDLPRDGADNPQHYEGERLMRAAADVETAGIPGDETRERTAEHYTFLANQDLTRLGAWFDGKVKLLIPELEALNHPADAEAEARRIVTLEMNHSFALLKDVKEVVKS